MNGTWNTIEMSLVISNVFTKLKNIICLINVGDGGNDLVEEQREKIHADMKFDFVSNTLKLEAFESVEGNGNSGSNNELLQDI